MAVRDDLEDSCTSCHERYFGDDVGHDPVAGGCDGCHLPHQSEFPALLKQDIFTLCTDCHDTPDELSQPAHAGADAGKCLACHDAHFGKSPLLKSGIVPPTASAPAAEDDEK